MSICDISAKIMSINEMTDIVFQIRNSRCGSILAHSKGLQISLALGFFSLFGVDFRWVIRKTDILNSEILVFFFFTLFKFFTCRLCLHRALATSDVVFNFFDVPVLIIKLAAFLSTSSSLSC